MLRQAPSTQGTMQPMMTIDQLYPGLLQKNVQLAPLTSFKIGGPADYYAEPKTPEQLEALITEAVKNSIPYYILGGGSNTLFSDKGFRGIVIKPQFKSVTVTATADGNSITAESGLLLSQLIQAATKYDLSGMEVWVGLPGTVGGAVRGNAGAGGKEIKDFLSSASIFDLKQQKIVEYTNAELEFGYRHSILKDKPHLIVLSATFHFDTKLPAEEQRILMKDTLAKRHATQPKGHSAGCAFKNEIDPVTQTVYSAGKLIDECGLKGTRIGGIEISNIHGNFLQNVTHELKAGALASPKGVGPVSDPPAPIATQQDVLDMIALIKKTVKEKKNIDLHEEVQVVGEHGAR